MTKRITPGQEDFYTAATECLENAAESVRKAVKTNLDDYRFVDLGLPSGTLWATANVVDHDNRPAYLSWDDAMEMFPHNVPSWELFQELEEQCEWKWVTASKTPGTKHPGYKVTGPNGASIFLPAAGFRRGSRVGSVGIGGNYWSSSVINKVDAYGVGFFGGHLYPRNDHYRHSEFSVRLSR